jgi:hypothetical protein
MRACRIVQGTERGRLSTRIQSVPGDAVVPLAVVGDGRTGSGGFVPGLERPATKYCQEVPTRSTVRGRPPRAGPRRVLPFRGRWWRMRGQMPPACGLYLFRLPS